MIYLLDANVLITAHRQYYAIDRIPEFWDWLVHMGELGHIKIPQEIYDEFSDGEDELAEWANQEHVSQALILNEVVDPIKLREVLKLGYGENLTDDELEQTGQDPFLIAHALTDPKNRKVVTTEVSKPTKTRANRHIPDVCTKLEVESLNTFKLLAELDFKTGWKV